MPVDDEYKRQLVWWAIPDGLAGMPRPYLAVERGMAEKNGLRDHDDDLPLLHDIGIRAVVCLLNQPQLATVYEGAGFDFLCLPIVDFQPPKIEQARELVQFIDGRGRDSGAVVVHCAAGMGRTGTMVAAYLMVQGKSVDEAIRHVRSVRPGAIETRGQEKFLEDWGRELA